MTTDQNNHLKNNGLKKFSVKKGLLLATALMLANSQLVYALPISLGTASPDWNPVASDKLVKLPANIIEKRIQKDFQASAMATRMVELDVDMQDNVTVIKSMLQIIPELEGEAAQNKRFELLQYKSEYLDLLQESHGLHQSALEKKQDLYSSVLDKMRLQSGKINNNESYQIQQAQIAARQRMEKVIHQVDQSLMHLGLEKKSPYTDEYSKNLNQIEKLKMAINQHQTNESPQVNGIDISSEEYLRQLLMAVSTEQSLLDQEALMLSYMAKLVALDAQALEYEMAYGDEESSGFITEASKAASVTTLFYQE
ncbi:hypothetical protein [Colwellia sp. TT2012]|uniref:hypothetical protein n=1 Tax=Colwellia sp. TT2012 TaxID=1720342 RepID=UPI000AB2C977|nr:hypothetical protein [Colwellia sp. TT2012]